MSEMLIFGRFVLAIGSGKLDCQEPFWDPWCDDTDRLFYAAAKPLQLPESRLSFMRFFLLCSSGPLSRCRLSQ